MKLTEKTVNLGVGALLVAGIVIGISSVDVEKYRKVWTETRKIFTQLAQEYDSVTKSASSLKRSSPAPSPFIYAEPTEEQKKYLIALGAIIAVQNKENLTELKSNFNQAELKRLMQEQWDISDTKSALAALDWLTMNGHRYEYEDTVNSLVKNNIRSCDELAKFGYDYGKAGGGVCRDEQIAFIHDFVKRLEPKLGGKSLYAWDYGRLVNVARWSYTLGYISERQAWEYIVPAGRKLQTEYTSWGEYGEHYLLGRAYWLMDLNSSSTQRGTLNYLINPINKTPWTTIDWNTHLK